MSGAAASALLSATVLKQIQRLGGRIPDDFQPRDWSVSTPAGEHPVPPPVQALLAVVWRPDQTLCTDDEFRWEVRLPAHGEVEHLVVEDTPRAWYAVGFDEGQWYLLVDLAEADTDDFPVYRVDHDGSSDAGLQRPLSGLLGDLRVVTDRVVVPDRVVAGEVAAAATVSADVLVSDASWLVNTDPFTVLPLLDRVTTARARLAAAVYRTSVGRHADADAATRRQLLALDAARWGAHELSRSLAEVVVPAAPPAEWQVDWATGGQLDTRRLSRLDVGGPQVVTVLNGRTVAVTLHGWTLHVHDLVTGAPIVETTLECSQEFTALAVAQLDGRWIAVTGSSCPGCDDHDTCQGQIQRWNLADGSALSAPVPAHLRSVDAVAVTEVAGRAVILSGGHDNLLRRWDLRTAEPIGSPVAGHRRVGDYGVGIMAIAVGELDGRRVAVTGGGDGAARVWDLTDGATPGQILLANTDYESEDAGITSLALGDLDGTPIVVTSGYDVRVWDLRSGQQLGPEVTDRWGHLDLAEVDGRPVVVVVDCDGWVQAWDLRTREAIGERVSVFAADRRVVGGLATAQLSGHVVAVVPDYQATTVVALRSGRAEPSPAGHTDAIAALAVTDSAGPPIAVTGATDGTARVWHLVDGTLLCPPLSGHRGPVGSVAAARVGDRAAVLTSDGHTIRVWDQATGELLRTIPTYQAEDGHQMQSLAAADLDGRPVAVTAGYDRRVLTWDLDDAVRASRPPIGLEQEYDHPLATAELDGRAVALVKDGTVVRVADLSSGAQLSTMEHEFNVDGYAVAESRGRVTAVTTTYQKLSVWDVATATMIHQLAFDGWGGALALADVDGHLVVAYAGRDETVHTWDLTADRAYRAPLRFPEKVEHLAVTSQGRLVVAFGSDLAVLSPRQ